MYYLTIFEFDGDGYQMYVPDVEGANAISETDDIDEAVNLMQEILKIILEKKEFKDWPKPSSLTEIQKQEAEFLNENTFIMPVKAIGTIGKNVRVNLSLPDYALDIIDQDAKKAGVTRSAYIASLALNR